MLRALGTGLAEEVFLGRVLHDLAAVHEDDAELVSAQAAAA